MSRHSTIIAAALVCTLLLSVFTGCGNRAAEPAGEMEPAGGKQEEVTPIKDPQPASPDASTGSTISCEYNGISISMPKQDGWEYSIDEHEDGCTSWGISFRPSGEDGWVRLHYWASFGVCGTGLEQKQITLDNGLTACQGTFDGHAVWDFLTFEADTGNFVAMTENVDSWWPQYGDEAMKILGASELDFTPA